MKRFCTLLTMAVLVCAQDVGGRDRGEGKNPVLFVRWQRLSESQGRHEVPSGSSTGK